MPYLGDYFGHLLSEITIARVQADLEAVRVAELYASHPLLKHWPVPRFRLPSVTVDVPVIIQSMEEAQDSRIPRGGTYRRPSSEHFDELLAAHLHDVELELAGEKLEALKTVLRNTIERLWRSPNVPTRSSLICNALHENVIQKLLEIKAEADKDEQERLEEFEERFREAIQAKVAGLMQPPPRLKVRVTTKEMRETGANEVLARFQLSISEEAYEWTVLEKDGKPQDQLIPE